MPSFSDIFTLGVPQDPKGNAKSESVREGRHLSLRALTDLLAQFLAAWGLGGRSLLLQSCFGKGLRFAMKTGGLPGRSMSGACRRGQARTGPFDCAQDMLRHVGSQ